VQYLGQFVRGCQSLLEACEQNRSGGLVSVSPLGCVYQ